MDNLNFLRFLTVFMLIRNFIYILDSIFMLIIIRSELNMTSKEMNFRMFLVILVHIMILWVDRDRVAANKFGFVFLLFLMCLLASHMRSIVKGSKDYLFENHETILEDVEKEDNDVE